MNSKILLKTFKSLKGADSERLDKSRVIFLSGERAKKIYLIKKGVVRLSRICQSGEETTISLLKENCLIGITSLLNEHQSKKSYLLTALTQVEMDAAPISSAKNAIELDRDLRLTLLEGLSSRILHAEAMIETLAQPDTPSRLVGFLLILCKDFGIQESKGITIDLTLSHHEIAKSIGSTRGTVCRLLGELRNSGYLKIDNQKIMIFDQKNLTKSLS